jgi:hypothetical protein
MNKKVNFLFNDRYEILTPNGFEPFGGITKIKKTFREITLENDVVLRVSHKHRLFTFEGEILSNKLRVGNKVKTVNGFLSIKKIKWCRHKINLYDIINSGKDHVYYTNGILSHNCQFLGSGGNLIDGEDIADQETENVRPPIWTNEKEDGNLWVWEHPIENEKYIITVDVATGAGSDYSTIVVLKVTEGRKEQVAEYQARVKPEELGERAYQIGRMYNDAYMVIDVTGGYGSVTMLTVLNLQYRNIHMSEIRAKPVKDRLQKHLRLDIQGREVVPGFSIGSNRTLMLQELERAVRMRELIVRSSRLISEFKTFVWDEGKGRFDHMRSAHDDILMAVAQGLYAFMANGKSSEDKARISAMVGSWVMGDNGNQNEMKLTQSQINQEAAKKGFIFTRGSDFMEF